MERCSSDPTVAERLGLLIQRVPPTVRNGLVSPSDPVTSRDGKPGNYPNEFDYPAERFVEVSREERILVDGESDDNDREPSPSYGSTNLLFANDYGHVLSSTPVAKGSTNIAPERKISELERQLRVQTDVNKELKRLLVASMGNDLQYRLNQIAEEKANISQSLDASLHRLAENHEEIDRVSIECDIWRSKFLASRLMVDELASWKAEITKQLKESQRALQCMLKESAELGNTLLQCNYHLNEVSTQLKLRGRNERHERSVLEVARVNCFTAKRLHKQLGEAISISSRTQQGIIGKATIGEEMARQVCM